MCLISADLLIFEVQSQKAVRSSKMFSVFSSISPPEHCVFLQVTRYLFVIQKTLQYGPENVMENKNKNNKKTATEKSFAQENLALLLSVPQPTSYALDVALVAQRNPLLKMCYKLKKFNLGVVFSVFDISLRSTVAFFPLFFLLLWPLMVIAGISLSI